MAKRAVCIWMFWIGVLACADDSGPRQEEPPPREDRTPLVSTEAWRVVDALEDPFEDRLDEVMCTVETAIQAEELAGEPVWSVDTADCNYVTATQPIATDIRKGETVAVRLWHFDLQANEPAKAHVALFLGDRVVWERNIPIPSTSRLIYETWEVDAYVAEGTPIYVHLHNHGSNSWSLIEVSTGGALDD